MDSKLRGCNGLIAMALYGRPCGNRVNFARSRGEAAMRRLLRVGLKRDPSDGKNSGRRPQGDNLDQIVTIASASISTSMFGAIKRLTSTIAVAGRIVPKTSPWARPILD